MLFASSFLSEAVRTFQLAIKGCVVALFRALQSSTYPFFDFSVLMSAFSLVIRLPVYALAIHHARHSARA